MVAQRYAPNKVHQETDHYGNEELIYVNKKKEEEAEDDELLVPVLLDSMFEARSPTALHEFPQCQQDNVSCDDSSTANLTPTASSTTSGGASTTTGLSNFILLPNLMMPDLSDDEDELELDTALSFSDNGPTTSFTSRELSPQTIVIPTNNSLHHPFIIPEDIRYDGQVIFATSSSTERSINLHPKPLNKGAFESIFMSNNNNSIPQHHVPHLYIEEEEYGNDYYYGGVEETKEDDDDDDEDCRRLNLDEGFAYVYGKQNSEEDYWSGYRGHHGSLDVMGEKRRTPYIYHKQMNYTTADTNHNDESEESLISLFADFFACGAYGKPFASASSTCSLPEEDPSILAGLSEEYYFQD